MSAAPEVQDVMLIPAKKAALMLCRSVDWLQDRRELHQPPPPAPNFAGRAKGSRVLYLARTLIQFIKDEPITQASPWSPTEPLPIAVNAASSRKKALDTKGAKRHLVKYASSTAEVEDATWPFFVDQAGRLTHPCWDTRESTIESFFDETTDLEWLCWVDALAKVWVDEEDRLKWLADAEHHSPGFSQRVQSLRSQRLSTL